MISLRLDGWRIAVDLTIGAQLLLLPFSLVFFWLLASLAGVLPTALTARLPLSRWTLPALATAIAATEQLFTLGLFAFEARYFRKVGYHWRPALWGSLLLASIAAFAWLLRTRPERRLVPLLLISCGLAVAGTAFCIASFPLNPLKSDNLPLIAAACQQFLHGHYPYFTYGLESGAVPLTYLPLTWLLYVPAAAAHVDIRWTNPLLAALAVLLVWRSTPAERKPAAASFLSVFLLLPFMQYHHDIYIAPQWFFLAVIYATLQRKCWWGAALAFGLGCAASQLFWVAVPFWLWYVLRQRGARHAVASLALVAGGAAAGMLPFLLVSPPTFLYCIFGHWQLMPRPNARVFNLSFWIVGAMAALHHLSTRVLQAVQALLLAMLFFTAVRQRITTQSRLFAWIGLAIALFGATNFVVWAYFYVTAFFALTLSLLQPTEREPA